MEVVGTVPAADPADGQPGTAAGGGGGTAQDGGVAVLVAASPPTPGAV